MGEIIALYIAPLEAERLESADPLHAALEATKRPNWTAGEAAIDAIDSAMVDRLRTPSWGDVADDICVEAAAGRGLLLGAGAQEVLRADLEALRDALDSPPHGLLTITLDNHATVHYLDEQALDAELGDSVDRLSDFGILQATGFTPGRW